MYEKGKSIMTEKKNVATIEKKMWIHPLIKERTGGEAQKGPFIKLENGTVMGYLVNKVNFSKDGLRFWGKMILIMRFLILISSSGKKLLQPVFLRI